jgi:hypothetical protein
MRMTPMNGEMGVRSSDDVQIRGVVEVVEQESKIAQRAETETWTMAAMAEPMALQAEETEPTMVLAASDALFARIERQQFVNHPGTNEVEPNPRPMHRQLILPPAP